MPVVKDLVPDLTHFYAQYASVKPWLQTRTPAPPDRERLQSKEDQEKIDGRPRASCARAARPLARATGGTAIATSGRRYCLQAYRWIVDTRDEATGERLDELEDPFRLYRCHTIMNCTRGLPEGPEPGQGDRRDQEDDGRAAELGRQAKYQAKVSGQSIRPKYQAKVSGKVSGQSIRPKYQARARTLPANTICILKQKRADSCGDAAGGRRSSTCSSHRYVQRSFDAASSDELKVLERLLALPDEELASYLFGHETPADPALATLAQRIACHSP